MPMPKSYLKFVPIARFGVVASLQSNVQYDPQTQTIASPALEDVVLWNVRTGDKTRVLRGDKHEVTCLARSPDSRSLAVGYSDGSIKIWNTADGTNTVTFNGHTSAVTALCYDPSGAVLASGARDTDVVMWDVISESGLYRLKGHKDAITQLRFIASHNVIVSSSKDTLIKVWDLDTQHCTHTLIGHREEVWSFDVCANGTRLVAGSSDGELRVWSIDAAVEDENRMEGVARALGLSFNYLGTVPRAGRERVGSIHVDPTGRYLVVQATDKTIEFYVVRSEEEVKRKLARKVRRLKEKEKHKGHTNAAAAAAADEAPERTPALEISHVYTVRASAKVRSMDFIPAPTSVSSGKNAVKARKASGAAEDGAKGDGDGSDSTTLRIAVALNNNRLEVHSVTLTSKSGESELLSAVESGHTADVRAIAISSEDSLILTASHSEVRVWNRKTGACVRTIESGYGLCATFLPGNRHALIGIKTGELQLFDLSAGTLLESTKAHQGAIWSLAVRPDNRGFVTGSADKEVRFWDFELVGGDRLGGGGKRLGFAHARTLKMEDDVLCVAYSPNGKLVCVSLLDSTVKVFVDDTLRFFLSMYGHKLPVTSMDISSDNALLVTASADKNVKIWGLDFGDCHKSIFAHEEGIMSVRFLRDTHHFFTAAKDGLVKYWDGDNFEHISTLESTHLGEAWCLAVAPSGDFVASGSHDRSIRVWERSEEMLFPEEEREREREEQFEADLAKDGDAEQQQRSGDADVAPATKRTAETLKAGELLMEAIDVCDEELLKAAEHARACEDAERVAASTKTKAIVPKPPVPHPLLTASRTESGSAYLLHVLRRIKAADIDDALLVLPFGYVSRLLPRVAEWLRAGREVELCTKCALYLIRIHHNPIVATGALADILEELRVATRRRTTELKDLVGFNLAALRFIKRDIEANTDVDFFGESNEAPIEQVKKKVKVFH
eukprot:Opistho-2@52294